MNTNRKLLFFFLLSFFSISCYLNAQIIHVDADFNNGNLPTGWTNTAISGTDRWQFGNDGSDFEAGNNNIDSTNMAYFDDDLLAGTALNNTAQLSTSSFNNSTNAATFLTFDYNFKSFSNLSDSFYVEVYDGVNWNIVFSVKTDDCGLYVGGGNQSSVCQLVGFPKAFIDISSYANSNCIVRFIYHDDNNWAWYGALDNVKIYSPEANDIGISSIIFPIDGVCSLSDSETISCMVINYSADTITGFEITAAIDNGIQLIVDTVNTTLLPFDSLSYSFVKKVDLSLLKSYEIQVSTSYSLDQNKKNDSAHVQIPSRSLKSLPYFDGFESATNDWTVSGTNPSWERGIPSNSVINKSPQGDNAFVTSLDSNYNANEFSFLNSPCISLDSSVTKLFISFDLIFNTEGPFDVLWMEYTTDGGLIWSKLEKPALPFNWYNVNPKKVWGGNSRDWINYYITLNKPINASGVKFRFVFKSDKANELEGVGIDNFFIRSVTPIDLILNKVISPAFDPALLCGFSSQQEVKVELINIGLNPIDSVKISYQIDNKFPFIEQLNDSISMGSSYIYTFINKGDFSAPKKIRLTLFIEYNNGTSLVQDTLTSIIYNDYFSYKRAPYFENFDSIFKPISGTWAIPITDKFNTAWSRMPELLTDGEYSWRVGKDSALRAFWSNGPLTDHTGNGGSYLFTYRKASTIVNSVTTVLSPCISLQSSNAELSFWYHRYATTATYTVISDLFIDVYENGQWDEGVDTISGINQVYANDPYLQKIIPLSNYSNEFIKIRFKVFIGIKPFIEMAIDDFHVYDTSIVTGLPTNVQRRKQLLLYPNPNNGEFTLATSKQLIGSRYVVFNISGQLVVNGILSNQKTKLNLADFGKGVYFIRIPEKNLSEKLIVY